VLVERNESGTDCSGQTQRRAEVREFIAAVAVKNLLGEWLPP
jgi:hypothetical protein